MRKFSALSVKAKVFVSISGLLLVGLLLLFLVRLPQSVAEQMVSRHPDYFLSHEADWKKENGLATQLWVKLLEFKLRQDIKEINLERLALAEKQPAEAINLLVEDVRRNYITKLQATVPVITNSTFASFVRGYGFCDHTNACLAYLLTGSMDDVAMVGLSDAIRPPHSVVRVKSELGVVYADAFTCTNVFGFEEEMSATGKALIPTYNQLERELYPPVSYHNGYEFNRFNAAYTLNKAFERLGQLALPAPQKAPAVEAPAGQKPAIPAKIVVSKTAEEAAVDSVYALHAQEPRDLKVLFLKARLSHLYNKEAEAKLRYEQVVAQAPQESLLASYARIFLARFAGTDKPCSTHLNYNNYFLKE